MSGYISPIAPWLEEFARYRTASGKFGESSHIRLKRFDRHCASFPGAETLTQEMVDTWMAVRPTEKGSSCRNRASTARVFIEWAVARKLVDVVLPERPQAEKSTFVPHSFSSSELRDFFHACDSISTRYNGIKEKLFKMTVPVFFRLLHSSGLRTCEGRLLKRSDVDLSTGVVDVDKSKGPDGHRIVLTESMLDLMRRYDAAVESLVPGREYMFTNPDGSVRSREWVCKTFRKMWKYASEDKARAYDFRAHYAATNIDSWEYEGGGWHWKLAILAKSMGHRQMQSTCHYYNITPYLYDRVTRASSEGINDLMPDLPESYGRANP